MKKLNKRGFLSLLNLIIILAILSLVSACGGGGGGDEATDLTGIHSITLEADATTLNAGQRTTVTAIVTDGTGAVVTGEEVTFSIPTNPSGATIAAVSGTTDANGIATATYTAGSNLPTTTVDDIIQASTSNATKSLIITRAAGDGSTTPTAGLSLTAASTSLKAGGETFLTATLIDETGNPVTGQAVVFSISTNNSGATITTMSGTTDYNGQATARYTAGNLFSTVPLQDTVQATSGTYTRSVIITRTAAAAGSLITLKADSQSLEAGEFTMLTAKVTDDSGTAVGGQAVTFSIPTNTIGSTVQTIGTGTTDANGEAMATYTAGLLLPTTSVQTIVQASIPNATKALIITRKASSVAAATGSLTLSLSSSVVTFGTPVTVNATLLNASGTPIPNAVVSFGSASSLVSFTPASKTALTNSSGVASISLDAASIDSAGATYVSASADIIVGETTSTITSTPVGVAVNGAAITLGAITLGQSTISSYGTSSVSVPVLINGLPATVPIAVNFNSGCVASNKATLSSPVTSNAVTSLASSTYKDNNCNSGSDVITASVTGGASSSVTITVTPPATSNIKFISATPQVIGTSVAASPLLAKTSIVKFQVVDTNGYGKAGVDVTFALKPENYLTFGITSDPVPGGVVRSDADGYVTIAVTSGTVPTPLWAFATIAGTDITSQSNTLTITTGLPTQNFFSLSTLGNHNIEGWRFDGETTDFQIIASDRLGNSVPDGTVINFIAEGGNLGNGPSQEGEPPTASCVTSNGACSVGLRSAEFRPTNGRVTILAYAIGEKSFRDTITGNNSYDAGETFYDLGNIYIDENENGLWDVGEQFFSYNSSTGTNACLTQPTLGALPYDWEVSSVQNTCNATWGINYVRRSTIVTFSDSTAFIDDTDPVTPPAPVSAATVEMGSNCVNSFSFSLMDFNNNPMPAGTEITATNLSVRSKCQGLIAATAETDIPVGATVGDSTTVGGTSFTLRVDGCNDLCEEDYYYYPSGQVSIDVTTPNGIITNFPITINNTKLDLTATSFSVPKSGNSTLTATVIDALGNPIPGLTVNFTFVENYSHGTITIVSGTTNPSGVATATYTAGNPLTAPLLPDTIRALVPTLGYKTSDDIDISVTD